MATFSTSFVSKKLKNEVLTSIKNVGTTPSQSILNALNNLRQQLDCKCGRVDSLLSALTCASTNIADSATESKSTITGTMSDFALIDDSIALDVIHGFSDCVHNGLNINYLDPVIAGVTLTDASGRIFNVFDQRVGHVVVDGKEILFSASYMPNNIGEAIIIKYGGHYYLNNFIRTADFVKATAERILPNTIYGRLQSMCIISGKINFDTIYTAICSLLGVEELEQDLYTALSSLADQYGLDYDYNLDSLTTVLWSYYNSILYPIAIAKGHVVSLWHLVSDLLESSTLNTYISDACDVLTSAKEKTSALSAMLTTAISSKYKSIKTFSYGVVKAFNRGGVYGAGCYIISYLKDLSNVTEDDQGIMHFTDNSRLTPSIYLAGLLEGIFTITSTVVSVIASFCNTIAGGVFFIIGSLASQVFKAFTYDYDSTNAAINNSDNAILPATPYGVLQLTVSPYVLYTNAQFKDLISQGQNTLALEVPGAYIFIGPGSFSDEGVINTYNIEVHPSLCDPGECFDTCVNMIKNFVWVKWTHDDKYYLKCDLVDAFAYYSESVRLLYESWSAHSQTHAFVNGSSDRLSNVDDGLAQQYICKNLFIFSIYLYLTTGYDIFNSTGQVYYDMYENLKYIWLGNSVTYNQYNLGPWIGFVCYSDSITLPVYYEDGSSSGDIITNHGKYNPSWLCIASETINKITTASTDYIYGIVYDYEYFNEPIIVPYSLEYILYIPKYDKKTFWIVVIGTAIATAVVAAAVAVTIFSVRNKLRKIASRNQAAVQAANEAFVQNPTDANYKMYKKAVFKNNMWANLTGGTKFDYVNYWNGSAEDQTSTGESTGEINNPLYTLFMNGSSDDTYQYKDDTIEYASDVQQAKSANEIKDETGTVIRLISGSYNPT